MLGYRQNLEVTFAIVQRVAVDMVDHKAGRAVHYQSVHVDVFGLMGARYSFVCVPPPA